MKLRVKRQKSRATRRALFSSAAAASRKGALDGRGGVNPVAVAGVAVGIVCLAAIGAWFVRSRKSA